MTGGGKSSILSVLTRMLSIEVLGDGEIEIDGINIEEFSLNDLRRSIATISSDPLVISGTL